MEEDKLMERILKELRHTNGQIVNMMRKLDESDIIDEINTSQDVDKLVEHLSFIKPCMMHVEKSDCGKYLNASWLLKRPDDVA